MARKNSQNLPVLRWWMITYYGISFEDSGVDLQEALTTRY